MTGRGRGPGLLGSPPKPVAASFKGTVSCHLLPWFAEKIQVTFEHTVRKLRVNTEALGSAGAASWTSGLCLRITAAPVPAGCCSFSRCEHRRVMAALKHSD